LNDYLNYNTDASDFYRAVQRFITELQDPQNVIEWSEEYVEEYGWEPSELTIEHLDRLLEWKLKQLDMNYLGKMVREMLHVREQHTVGRDRSTEKPLPKVMWKKSA